MSGGPKTYSRLLETRLTTQSHRIHQLTEQARADLNHDAYLADNNVHAIIQHIIKQKADDRVAGLYLIDSIVRRVGGRYIPLFQEHIVPLFVATYKHGTRVREKCTRILDEWKKSKVFPMETFKQLYKQLQDVSRGPYQPAPSYPSRAPTQSNPYRPRPERQQYPPYRDYHDYRGADPYQPGQPGWGGRPPQYEGMYGHSQYDRGNRRPHFEGPPPPPMPIPAPNPWGAHPSEDQRYKAEMGILLRELNAFVKNPRAYNSGINMFKTSTGYVIPKEVHEELRKITYEHMNGNMDPRLRNQIYPILSRLKNDQVDVQTFEEMLKRLSDERSVRPAKRKREVCPFYNSPDGCPKTQCDMLHITSNEATVRKALSERNRDRYTLDEVVRDKAEGSEVTLYTFFGGDPTTLSSNLTKKHLRSVSLLYSHKLQICPNCALRLPQKALDDHLSWHFEMNRQENERKKRSAHRCRSWYLEEEQWIEDVGNQLRDVVKPFDLPANGDPTVTEDMDTRVYLPEMKHNSKSSSSSSSEESERSGNELGIVCEICDEPFLTKDKTFVPEKDDWMIDKACYIDGTSAKDYPAGRRREVPIVHRRCYITRKHLDKIGSNAPLLPNLKPKLNFEHLDIFNETHENEQESANENEKNADKVKSTDKQAKQPTVVGKPSMEVAQSDVEMRDEEGPESGVVSEGQAKSEDKKDVLGGEGEESEGESEEETDEESESDSDDEIVLFDTTLSAFQQEESEQMHTNAQEMQDLDVGKVDTP